MHVRRSNRNVAQRRWLELSVPSPLLRSEAAGDSPSSKRGAETTSSCLHRRTAITDDPNSKGLFLENAVHGSISFGKFTKLAASGMFVAPPVGLHSVTDSLREQLEHSLGGAYAVERELGGGGMSRTFVAEDISLGRRVVVKVLPEELTSAVSLERFKREIQVAARLQHAHIVPVLTAGEVSTSGDRDGPRLPFYTMPFVEGESLRARLERGPLSIGEVVPVLRDVARALAYAHERGVVHRDIKPDNVLLSAGSAVVADFGIAKALTAARADGETRSTALTAVGISIGTPAYMAPEQAAGDPATDHRADIYAFGCTAYELLVGRSPFHGLSPQRLLAAQMGERPRPIAQERSDTPPALAAIIASCLEKDAALRPQRAADIVTALEAVSGTHSAMTVALFDDRRMFAKAVGAYAGAFVATAVLAKLAIVAIGLPDWVFPGILVVMALGLPIVLFTGYTQFVARRIGASTATLTPSKLPAPTGAMASIALKAAPHLSWRRSAFGGVVALVAFVAAVGLYMLLRQLGIGPEGSLFGAGKLAAADRVLIADFSVSREDSALVPMFSEMLRATMGQSRALRLVPPDEVAATLVQMRKERSTRLDADIASEVAARVGAKAILGGRAARVGSGYALSLTLSSGQGAAVLASYQATANDLQGLFAAIDGLTRKLRGRVGESLRLVQRSVPLERATTTSLEALRKYSEGARANDTENDFDRAKRLLREAVALDSTFALAWRKLFLAHANSGFGGSAGDSALERAAAFADKLPDREKYVVLGQYYQSPKSRGANRAKALAAFQAAYAADSNFYSAADQLKFTFYALRQYDSAARYARRELAAQPSTTNGGLAAMQLAFTGQLTEAKRLLDSVRHADSTAARNVRVMEARFFLAYSADDRDSARAAAQDLVRYGGSRGAVVGGDELIDDANIHGALHQARLASARRDSAFDRNGIQFGGINAAMRRAEQDLWYLDGPKQAVRELDAALATGDFERIDISGRPDLDIATLYARAGASDKAEQMVARFEREAPFAHSPTNLAGIQRVRAEIALAHGSARVAVDLFRRSDTASDGPVPCEACTYWGLGRAFDKANLPDSAMAYYERYLALPRARRERTDAQALSETELRLGELYEEKSDWTRAEAHYDAFVSLWRQADSELQPKVAEVRRRLERIRKRAG
jgi:tRNA A-37 threonylcarbamoyl transferase component Bud32/tetratricopeptide (TPR) repeat protein